MLQGEEGELPGMRVIVSVFPMNVYVHVLVCSCVHAWYEVYVGDVCALLCVFSCVCVHQRSCEKEQVELSLIRSCATLAIWRFTFRDVINTVLVRS